MPLWELFGLDNTAKLTAEKLQIKKLKITTEQSSACSVNAEKKLNSASERSEIQLYGNPKSTYSNLAMSKLLKKN
jgi:hypothetical protein